MEVKVVQALCTQKKLGTKFENRKLARKIQDMEKRIRRGTTIELENQIWEIKTTITENLCCRTY